MARNQQLNQKMKDERREIILLKALHLFACNGLAGTKITDIARDCGMSQGLVYHYFKSKEEIFTELINISISQMSEAARGLQTLDLPPAEKIKLAMEVLIAGFVRNHDSGKYHLLVSVASASDAIPEAAKQILANRGEVYSIIAKILQEGQKQGTIKNFNVDDMSMLFWTTVKGLAMHKAALGDQFKAPDIKIILSMFLTEISEKDNA